MPHVTPLKSWALKTAKIYPTVDRCDRIKGFRNIDFKSGFNSFRNIENEEYKYIFPKEKEGLAMFSSKVKRKPHEDRLSVDEIDLIIRDKFITERHWIQELFRISDVHKQGFVTKEALMKIFFSICGNLKIDHFYKLLERYKLNLKSVITFSDVEKVFGLPPTGKYPPPIIFHGMGHPYNVSSAYALHLLREAALDKDFDLKSILPESCFEEGGVILMSQFREALTRIKIKLCDEDFARLWNKLDIKGVGSISLRQILWILNLQDNGKPMCGIRSTFTPLKRPKIERVIRTKPPLKYTNCYELSKQIPELDIRAGDVSFPLIKGYSWKPKGPGGSDEYEFGKGTQFFHGLQKLRENRPEFKSIMELLSYIFEEPYQGMLVVFKQYDSRNSGFVELGTGLKILSEYGFVIECGNLIKFLNKVNCLDLNSGMNYKKLITDIQIKGPGTCVNRMISQIIKAENQSTGLKSLRTMSVDEIEQEFYKILHKDFMYFQSQLEKAAISSNFIYENEVKRIIENILGYSITKAQWKDLQFQFDYCQPLSENDEENLNRKIDFRKFLEKFSKPTGICRYRYKSDLDKPIDWSNRNKKTKEYYDPPRDHAYLCRMVADVLRFRFHAIDKQYKSFAHKLQGTLTRDILFELLNNQKCNLTSQEMGIIWAVVESHPHYSTWHYRQVLKHLMTSLYKKAEEIITENRKTTAEDPNIEVLREFKNQHKDDNIKKEEYCNKKIDMALYVKNFQVDKEKSMKTIEKMSQTMSGIWKSFKQQLRQLDIVGKATIEMFEMKNLLIKNGFVLTADETDNLLYAYDFKRNGRFYYIEFLNEFLKFKPDEGAAKPILHFDRVRQQLVNELLKEWKSLIRAFRKIDINKTGKLDQNQLHKILKKSGIRLSEDDLYHVFSGFDKNLDGKIDYVEFIEQLLDVFAPNPS